MFRVLNKLVLHSEAFLLVFLSIFADYENPRILERWHRVFYQLDQWTTRVEDGVLLLYLFIT